MTDRSAMLIELEQVTLRVERLAALCRQLGDENRALRQAHEQLSSERASIVARNEQARSRVEAMIQRLKALEHGTG